MKTIDLSNPSLYLDLAEALRASRNACRQHSLHCTGCNNFAFDGCIQLAKAVIGVLKEKS